MQRGDRLTLTVERPAAGGRMIARHEGAIVFVAGAIPGEVVEAEVEKVQRGTAWAITRAVIAASPDRIAGAADGGCGGCVFSHIGYERQRAIKAAIVEDSFRRLARITLDAPVDVVGSPIDGYRMRARLHVRGGRIGFFREGTHSLCDPGPTRQLRPDTLAVLLALEQALKGLGRDVVSEVELSENVDASERALHLELIARLDPAPLVAATRIAGLVGVTCAPPETARTTELWGTATVADVVSGARMSRHARSFFQGNRFLLQPLVDHVLSHVTRGPVLDLYAGVGLFSLSAACAGHGPVVAVEGDASSAADLRRNAAGRTDLKVRSESVERYLPGAARAETIVLDPPRTGLSKEALAGVIAVGASTVVYVSCDIATLARDARLLLDAGYRLAGVRAFDLFPNTAHVETVIAFAR
ncbi:MAG: class I SAM-dependent RNA methyltransferase [Vicinamibacterales bacterium]